MNFLTVDDVRHLHDLRVPDAALVDPSALDSALNRPRQRQDYDDEATIHDMAAVMAEGICQAHAFTDGNKRTAVLAVVAFYVLNGHTFHAPDSELLHLIVDLTTHDVDAAKASELFSLWAYPLPDEDDDLDDK